MNWKSTVVVSGAGIVATWLFSTPPATPTGSASAAPVATTRSTESSDIQREAERLQMKLHADTRFEEPSRNPFRFKSRPAPHAAAPGRVVDVAPPLPPEPPRPAVHLSGIASDGAGGTVVRTAILSTSADVLLLKEGESAAGYRVTKIGDDAVELVGPDGAAMTLTLRP